MNRAAEQFVRSELDRARAERERLQRRIQDVEVLARYLESQLAKMTDGASAGASSGTKRRRQAKGGPTIRGTVSEFIERGDWFSTSDLIRAVREVLPEARPDTIRAELSHSFTRGLLEKNADGRYRWLGTGSSPART